MKIINLLPGIYEEFARNDYTAIFFKKGKVRPIQLMQKNEKFVDVLTNHGDFLLKTFRLNVFEEFTSPLYVHKLHFDEKTKPNCIEKPLGDNESVEQHFYY